MKRYEYQDISEDWEQAYFSMVESQFGDWVRYDDVQAERLLLAKALRDAVPWREGKETSLIREEIQEAYQLAERIVEGGGA